MSSDRDQLAELLDIHLGDPDRDTATREFLARETATLIIEKGWSPPPRRIESRDLAELPTGTVVLFPEGDVGSIDHGPHEEWTGSATRIHLLQPGGGFLLVADIPRGGRAIRIVWSPTEKVDS